MIRRGSATSLADPGPGASASSGAQAVRPGYLLPPRATRLAVGALMLGLFLAVVNQTIVATALPTIANDLGGGADYAWVLTAFLLASIVSAPLFGRLSDIHGRRPLFVTAVSLFILGGSLSALATSMGQLIAARGVHGLGAGALMSLAFITLGDLAPLADRGRWQALAGSVLIVGSVVGPMAGGYIADGASWRWVFLVSLPFAVAALIAGAFALKIPRHPNRDRRVDYVGAALLAGTLIGLLVGVARWGDGAGLLDGAAVLPVAAGLVLGALLVRQSRRAPVPFVPLELLQNRLMRDACLSYLFIGGAMFGAILYVPLFVQGVLGASAASSGLVLMPLLLAMNTTSIVTGQAISRSGRYRWAILPGPLVTAAGFLVLSSLDENSSLWGAVVATVVIGIGLGLLVHNLLLVVQNGVASRHLGSATGATQLFRNAGATIGAAVMGAVVSSDLASIAPDASASARGALAGGMHVMFLLFVPLMLLTFALLLRTPELPLRPAVREDVESLAVVAAS